MPPFPNATPVPAPSSSSPPSSSLQSSSLSSSSSHLSLALSTVSFFKLSSQKEFCRVGGAIDPFTSIHSIHLFIRWLSSLTVRKYLPSDLLLVAWAVRGLPAGLGTFLRWSLGWEKPSEERLNLEYLTWHLEMWRSVFSSIEIVENAREKGKSRDTLISEWYANAPEERGKALQAGRGYWGWFSGMEDEPMPHPSEDPRCCDYVPCDTKAPKSFSTSSGWEDEL